MTRLLLSALALATIAAVPGLAQDTRIDARLDPATAAEVRSALATARNQGLPLEPLIDRALEGASKGASSGRIVAAVRALLNNLSRAAQALGPDAAERELVAGAEALRAGADSATLAAIRGARRGEPVTVPLGVLTDLVARGVPADAAREAVLALARRGARDGDFLALRRNVERDIQQGAPPAIAASVRARGLPSTLPPGAPGAAGPGATTERTAPAGTATPPRP
ncbi:MAG TPA: hypothetical protein VNL98_02065 [Gemmatimonadales bacterium]|nr:hypothetical protein [Gemmatimonadales bacterium]